jgi:4-oxalocrotonate tautomerase
MPLVEITLAEGRSPQMLRALLHEVHAAVVRAVEVPDASVRVVIREVPPTHWSAGDVTIAERRAQPAAPAAVPPVAPAATPPEAPAPGPDWIGSTSPGSTRP